MIFFFPKHVAAITACLAGEDNLLIVDQLPTAGKSHLGHILSGYIRGQDRLKTFAGMCKLLPCLVLLSVALWRANFFSKANTITFEFAFFCTSHSILFWFSMLHVRQGVADGMPTGISDSAIT